jgi:hypothetical protein
MLMSWRHSEFNIFSGPKIQPGDEKALENLKKAEGMYQEMGLDYWLGKTQEVLGRL